MKWLKCREGVYLTWVPMVSVFGPRPTPRIGDVLGAPKDAVVVVVNISTGWWAGLGGFGLPKGFTLGLDVGWLGFGVVLAMANSGKLQRILKANPCRNGQFAMEVCRMAIQNKCQNFMFNVQQLYAFSE